MMQKLNARFVACLLLLAFVQKMGLELWLHHFLHERPVCVERHEPGNAYLHQAPVDCHCLDDTLMPLIEVDGFACTTPVQPWVVVLAFPEARTVSRDPFFSALRGPPAFFS